MTPDGRYLYYGMMDELYVWDLKSKTMKTMLSYNAEITNIITHDMKTFVTNSESLTFFL